MTGRQLSELLAGGGVRPKGDPGPDPEILGVRIDSRRAKPGDLFVALPGARVDGAAFAVEAVERGARAVLAAGARPEGLNPDVAWVRVDEPRRAGARVTREWFGRPDESLALVGITGTNGKTTVAYLVESIARAAGRDAGRIGTVGYAYAGREVPADRTTPEFTEFYELLAAMREARTQVVAVEVSSHALALGRVEGARFPVATFLNLGRDHLDFHGSLDAYFAAKATLFEGLHPDDTAVLPTDDTRGDELAGRTRARVLRYGRAASASVRLREERCGIEGSGAVLETPRGSIRVRTPLLGRFNLDNVAAAAACAVALGLDDEAIVRGVAALSRVPGRLERMDCGQPFGVFVDYAHTPEALARMLAAVREVTTGRVIVAFGCGGDRDRGKRPRMGRAAAECADRIYLTSDNPRNEDPVAILRDVRAGIDEIDGAASRCFEEPERAAAVAAAVAAAAPGDTVVIAGKGHETTQSFADRAEHLDDRELARASLRALGYDGGARGDA